MPRKKKADPTNEPSAPADPIGAISYPAKRRHIPPAGLEAEGRIAKTGEVRYEYNPHKPPVLRFSDDPAKTDELPLLLQRAKQRPLSDPEIQQLAEALRNHEPWLEWSGKREKPWFAVDPSPLHIHERVSTRAILRVLKREEAQRDLFADPEMEYREAVKFYEHEVDWSNRMILGDSLQVMASLARREDLAGKVQMIYLDPPYGIKFSSNFQPQLGQRDVKDRQADLTREPEMVKAYRDTWTLGVHSYLAYLRDRLAMAKELLTDSGSLFVQISDENLHRVRFILDEVFGANNFCSIVSFQKTGSMAGQLLPTTVDYILWYAKDRERTKYIQLFQERKAGDKSLDRYDQVFEPTGHARKFTKQDFIDNDKNLKRFQLTSLFSDGASKSDQRFEFRGKTYMPKGNAHWKTTLDGLKRLGKSERIGPQGERLRYVRLAEDFNLIPLTDRWESVQLGMEGIYVVQTSTQVIQRCLLMTTDPGDLVLDPTCGSGTTAYVAEQWGRRWITIDTSRVALALAKQRLLTARFPYYKLRSLTEEDRNRNPGGTWLKNGADVDSRTLDCKRVPHITLKIIARNANLDPLFEKHEPILAGKLQRLNAALRINASKDLHSRLVAKLVAKVLDEGVRSVTGADVRRWLLPGTDPKLIREKRAAKFIEQIPPEPEWREWEVPFDADPDWPKPMVQALSEYRAAWREKMDEVNACIAENATSEELVDQPAEDRNVVRVSGPFTMESVISLEQGPDSPIGGAPESLETFPEEAEEAPGIELKNVEAHLEKTLRLLKASGVDFPGNRNVKFESLAPVSGGGSLIHAEGEWPGGDGENHLVAVSVGPEVGNLTPFQVEDVIRSANRRGYDDVVFAAFGFDAAAQATIEDQTHPNLRLHMALIRPDVAMDELLKTQPGSQLFTVFSAPRIAPPEQQEDGSFVLEVEGMDVYDPVENALHPTDKSQIAAWFLDVDYDGRTFCVCQAFFPDKTKWKNLAGALGDKKVIDEEKFADLSGHKSLPFHRPSRLKPGQPWRVAVKVIDPRGNEGMRVVTLDGEVRYDG
jgi:adenine-specific DNA-methyltransferase